MYTQLLPKYTAEHCVFSMKLLVPEQGQEEPEVPCPSTEQGSVREKYYALGEVPVIQRRKYSIILEGESGWKQASLNQAN